MRRLTAGKSPGIDNVPSELLWARQQEEAATLVMTTICQKIWETKEWPKQWAQSLVKPLSKKGNFRQCQSYRTISLISYPSKIIFRGFLNRLKAEAKELLAEEQASFRPGRSTVDWIFNNRHPTIPARSVPQIHRLQENVWQSLACRSVAGPQKLQHSGRTSSSYSGTIWELQQFWTVS